MDPETAPTPEVPELDYDAAADTLAEELHLIDPPEPEPAPDKGAGDSSPSEPAAAPASPPQGKPGTAAPGEDGAPAPAPTPEPAPDTWRKEAKEAWAALPPGIREEVKKREGDIAKYVADTKNSVVISKEFERIIEPYVPFFQKSGVDPWKYTRELIGTHMSLMYGTPEQKQAALSVMASQAGYRLPQGQGVQFDASQHRINALEQELNQLRQGVTGVTTAVQEARLAELESAVMAFAQDGEKHPYFDEVAEEIHRLIQIGAAPTLEDAYTLAVNANPITRQKLIDQAIEKRSKNLSALEKARAAKAQKAAQVNVRSTAHGGRAPTLPGTIDDTLRETLAEINSRT